MQELKCNTCGAQIGGVNHRLRSDNVGARRYDSITPMTKAMWRTCSVCSACA